MPVVSVPPRRQAKDAAAHRSGLSSSSEKSAVYWPLVCFLSVPCWQQAKLALVLRPLSPKIRLSSTGSKGQEKVTVMLFFWLDSRYTGAASIRRVFCEANISSASKSLHILKLSVSRSSVNAFSTLPQRMRLRASFSALAIASQSAFQRSDRSLRPSSAVSQYSRSIAFW